MQALSGFHRPVLFLFRFLDERRFCCEDHDRTIIHRMMELRARGIHFHRPELLCNADSEPASANDRSKRLADEP